MGLRRCVARLCTLHYTQEYRIVRELIANLGFLVACGFGDTGDQERRESYRGGEQEFVELKGVEYPQSEGGGFPVCKPYYPVLALTSRLIGTTHYLSLVLA